MDATEYQKEYGGFFETLMQFGERYRADAAVRARVAAGDLSDLDWEVPAGVEVRVVEQSAGTFYFPLPPEPESTLSDGALAHVAGGTGSAGLNTMSTDPCVATVMVIGGRRIG